MSSLCQHPLAYLLGPEGVALMRACAGDHDRQFTLDRIDDEPEPLAPGEPSASGSFIRSCRPRRTPSATTGGP